MRHIYIDRLKLTQNIEFTLWFTPLSVNFLSLASIGFYPGPFAVDLNVSCGLVTNDAIEPWQKSRADFPGSGGVSLKTKYSQFNESFIRTYT